MISAIFQTAADIHLLVIDVRTPHTRHNAVFIIAMKICARMDHFLRHNIGKRRLLRNIKREGGDLHFSAVGGVPGREVLL